VLIDPFFTGNSTAVVSPDKVDCDIICVTHGHGDHLGDAVQIARRTGAVVASILEMSNYLERTGVKAVGFNLGGTVKIRNTSITMVPAFHSSSIGAPGLEFSAAMAAGMVIDSGKTVYHAGDTCVFGDMKLIGEMYKPQVALLPIGGFFTMDPEQAAMAVKLIKPRSPSRCTTTHGRLSSRTPRSSRSWSRSRRRPRWLCSSPASAWKSDLKWPTF